MASRIGGDTGADFHHSHAAPTKSGRIWNAMVARRAGWSTVEKDLGGFPWTPKPEGVLSGQLESFRHDIAPFSGVSTVFLKALQAQDNIEARRTFTWEQAHVWLWDRLCSSAPIRRLFPDTAEAHRQTVKAEEDLVTGTRKLIDNLCALDELRVNYVGTRFIGRILPVAVGELREDRDVPAGNRDALADVLLGGRHPQYPASRQGALAGLEGAPGRELTARQMADELERRVRTARALVDATVPVPPPVTAPPAAIVRDPEEMD